MQLVGKHIFIVEDNALNRVVYQITLGVAGAFLEFDRWGSEAAHRLQIIRNCDLIILDLMLQRGVSGFDVFKEIRAIHQHQAVPIVAISASEPAVAIPMAKELGFSGFISKPIDEALIVKQVTRLIDGEQIWYDGVQIGR